MDFSYVEALIRDCSKLCAFRSWTDLIQKPEYLVKRVIL
jgi:hypothetical protein